MADKREVLVPDIGEFSGVEIIEVLVSAGDRIEVDDSLITLESDKASMEIPSPCAGLVQEVAVAVGETVSEGDLLLVMEVDASDNADAEVEQPDQEREPIPEPAVKETDIAQPSAPVEDSEVMVTAVQRLPGEKDSAAHPAAEQPLEVAKGKVHASPSVRRFARKLGADLLLVKGSGAKGRILKEDVQSFIKKSLSGGGGAVTAGSLRLPSLPEIAFSSFGEIEERPLSRIKKISSRHLTACWLNIPHVTQFDEADITELEAFRQEQKSMAAKQEISLTLLAFLMKASVGTLREMPEFNSSLDPGGEKLIYKKYFNIGVAVDTPNGLVVPVIRGVERMGIYEIAKNLMEMSARAREGKLSPGDMQGGCFTISSLGGIGGTAFTPIINAPEVALLGVSRSYMKPVWNGAEFIPRLMLPLSLSYDHRVIDGAQAARFTSLLSGMLSDIRRLLL